MLHEISFQSVSIVLIGSSHTLNFTIYYCSALPTFGFSLLSPRRSSCQQFSKGTLQVECNDCAFLVVMDVVGMVAWSRVCASGCVCYFYPLWLSCMHVSSE